MQSKRDPSEPGPMNRVVRGRAPDPEGALARLEVVVHEMAGVLDGSLRLLDLAGGALRRQGSIEGGVPGGAEALRHLESARTAMAHVADLIREESGGARWTLCGVDGRQSVGSAVRHAADVMEAQASSRGISIYAEADPVLDEVPARGVYSVLINGVRNAIESIGVDGAGTIELRALVETGADGVERVTLEILDDGRGPAESALARAFERGFSTKAGSTGIGLSLARQVIEELGGTIELRARWSGNVERPGAVLRACYPVPGRDVRSGEQPC